LISALLVGCERNNPQATAAVQNVADKQAPAQTPLSYNHDIRPILSDKCFACHGPDRAARAAELRLDMPEDGSNYSGAMSVIEPGDPDASELIHRIESDKSKIVMPPPKFKVTLTEQEKSLLRRWVEEGAKFERHWAFVSLPKQVALPEVNDASWPRDEIDLFVLDQIERHGLKPTPEASRERWIRRVSYDLTGLPPTPEDVDAFVADTSDLAYEKVVDRLLNSPHYGERMAVPWLDLARYADTYGFSVDGLRMTWPWRDWVVQAFNENLPYDKFVTWQLAGDLMENPTQQQVLATAFNRLHRMNAEGGAIPEEWRNEGVADRLHTFGTAFLGLTFECARCHDHRYDPIEQRDYYELFAFFNSIDESGTTEFNRPDIIPPPSMLLPSDEQAQKLEQLRQAAQRAESQYAASLVEREPAFKAWLESSDAQPIITDMIGDYGFDSIENNQLINRVIDGAPGKLGRVESPAPPTLDEGFADKALRFDGDNYAALPGMKDIDRWKPFTVAMWLKVDTLDSGEPRMIARRTSGTDVGPYGFDLLLDGKRVMARAYRHWPGNAIAVRTGELIEAGKWVHLVWRYDGSSRASGLSLMINGELAAVEAVRDGKLRKSVDIGNPFGPDSRDLLIGQRFRARGLSGGVVDEVKLVRREVSDIEAKQFFDGKSLADALASKDAAALRSYYLSAIDEPARQSYAELFSAREAFVKHETSIPEIAVMEELPTPRPTYLLFRGQYDAEKTPETLVSRDVPASVMPWIEGLPKNRLGLAQWLTHPDHPLTSRVAVNRLWQMCLGKGIVSTIENFGQQGLMPTHPDLIDYLAREYIDSGWDTKAMLRRIVLSATYRQDSASSLENRQADPENRLLSRGPARRMDAEMIRDTALSASGLLVERLGGQPAYPYQPEGLWNDYTYSSYKLGEGEDLYRRSMYTVWKRTVPMPNMMAFDTPTREACTAQRQSTNTPLQALVLLNDVQYVEAMRVLAQRVILERQGDEARIERGFRLLTGRAPSEAESARLKELLETQRALFNAAPKDAESLLAVGQFKRNESIDATEHAAVTVVMHAILNLDATTWRR